MIYICGHTGYIGSNLMRLYPDCVPVDKGEIPPATEGDAVINLVAYGTYPNQDDVDKMVQANTIWPIKLKRFIPETVTLIHAATSSERDDPTTQYAKSKSIASRALYGKATLAYIYTAFGGVNEPQHRFMSKLIQTARNGGTFLLTEPNAMRDFIHVDHVCKGLIQLTKEKPPLLEAHLGSGQAYFLDRVAMMAVKMAKGKMMLIKEKHKGKMLYPAQAPYVTTDFIEDLRREITQ